MTAVVGWAEIVGGGGGGGAEETGHIIRSR